LQYPYIVPIEQARVGDIVLCDRGGFLAAALSFLIQKVKEPRWDRKKWHTMPVVGPGLVFDARWPHLKIVGIDTFDLSKLTVWRIMDRPDPYRVYKFLQTYTGCPYDALVYLWTAIRVFWRSFPRILNRAFSCWEITFCFIDEMGADFQSDFEYPFITDFLKWVGALK